MKENKNGVSLYATGCGKDADPLASEIANRDKFWNDTEHRCSPVAEDFINEIIHSTPKDNQNETLYPLKGHGGDTALFSSDSDEANRLEGSGFVANFTSSNEDENKDSAVKETENGFLRHSNCTGSDPDSFLSEATNRNEISNASKYRHSVVVDGFISTYENKSRGFLEPCSISLELLKKDMDLYTDKNVMECELPEVVVCYKESIVNIIKVICVDEGVPSKDNFFFECSEEDRKSHCTSLMACDKSNIMKENIGTTLVPDGLRPSLEKGCDMDTTKECIAEAVDTESLLQNHMQLSESIVKDASNECLADDPLQIGEANCRPTDKIVADFSSEDCALNGTPAQDCDTQKSLAHFFLDEDSKYESNTVEEQSGQISSVKQNSEGRNLIVATGESNKDRASDNLFYDNKVENGNVNSDLDSSKSAAHRRDEKQGANNLRPLEAQNVPRPGGSLFDNHSASNQVLCGEGESSFSAAGPISGLISSSGPIAYSGSMSRRSDSSTTSTRSFAFPVLQSEWNSSPERMAKADRRQYQKHRGWKQGLLCCRF